MGNTERNELREEAFHEALEQQCRPPEQRRAELIDLARRVRGLGTTKAHAKAQELEQRAAELAPRAVRDLIRGARVRLDQASAALYSGPAWPSAAAYLRAAVELAERARVTAHGQVPAGHPQACELCGGTGRFVDAPCRCSAGDAGREARRA